MTTATNKDQDKKLTVIFRVESGCLGPEGKSHIVGFCNFAHNKFLDNNVSYLQWQISPRLDKTLPEIQYKLGNKTLSHEKAARYLSVFKENIDTFEEHLNEKLMLLIDEYFAN
ncbi:MAG: hypothetical protein GXP13_02725 [Gammaproteobacteria bacterium]|nr:hypothetical protein [Gammaproteobacteria bacterium]